MIHYQLLEQPLKIVYLMVNQAVRTEEYMIQLKRLIVTLNMISSLIRAIIRYLRRELVV